MARPSTVRSETGASLIEIVIALSILTTVLIALGALMFQVTRDGTRSALAGYRGAATASAAAWALALPYDSLAQAIGCRNDAVGPLSYTRCTTVLPINAQLKYVIVVISPQSGIVDRPDTVLITRAKPKLPSPLKVP